VLSALEPGPVVQQGLGNAPGKPLFSSLMVLPNRIVNIAKAVLCAIPGALKLKGDGTDRAVTPTSRKRGEDNHLKRKRKERKT
jgi:hypothetical protein